MAYNLINVEVQFGPLFKSLKEIAPVTAKELRKELRAVGVELRDATRRDVPSGMQEAANAGVKVTFGAKNAVQVTAGGKHSPASWIGAAEGARGNQGWNHPVFPAAGSDRKTWNWAGPQPPKRMLQEHYLEMASSLRARADAAIDRAVKAAGLQGD